MSKHDRDATLLKAIALAGGRERVAATFGITGAAVSQWKRCPPERAYDLAKMTGDEITPEDLRPDVFKWPRQKAG